MSYCRWGEDGSDVYIYPTWGPGGADGIECMSCPLSPPDEDGWRAPFAAAGPADMLAHVEAHLAAGHVVGPRAIERLKREIAGP